MKWPTGRYNGRKIDGFYVSFCLHLLDWQWRPLWRWNFGEPYFLWLCFTWRARLSFNDL